MKYWVVATKCTVPTALYTLKYIYTALNVMFAIGTLLNSVALQVLQLVSYLTPTRGRHVS